MMVYVLGQLVLTSAFLTAVYLLVPRLALGGVLFGVTVVEGFATTPAGQAIVRRYRAHVVVAGVAGLLGVTAGLAMDRVPAGGVSILVQVALCTAAWVAARAHTRPHAVASAPVRRAVLVPAPPAALSPLLEAVPFGLLATAGVVLGLSWERIPERFPVHWGLEGPDRFSERTPLGVFGPLLLGTILCLGMIGLRAAILALSPSRPGDARASALRSLLRTSLLGASLLVALSLAGAALSPLTGGPWLTLVLSGIGVVALLALVGVTAVRVASLPPGGPGDGTPDDRWKWGLVYVNPDDPAIFVPKRAGLGYTINLGRPGGVAVMAAILAVPLVVALLSALGLR